MERSDNEEEPIIRENIFARQSPRQQRDNLEEFLNHNSPVPKLNASGNFTSYQSPRKRKSFRFSAASVVFDPVTDEVVHTVEKQDTLAGLAIRYGCSVNKIMRANKMYNRNAFHSRRTIKIPIKRDAFYAHIKKSEGERSKKKQERSDMATQFAEIFNCSNHMAYTYLEKAKYDFDRAMTLYQMQNHVNLPSDDTKSTSEDMLVIPTDDGSNASSFDNSPKISVGSFYESSTGRKTSRPLSKRTIDKMTQTQDDLFPM